MEFVYLDYEIAIAKKTSKEKFVCEGKLLECLLKSYSIEV